MTNKRFFLFGMKQGVPIVIGFIPIAIAYAIMGKNQGLSTFEITFMSLSVFGGASQMMALGMMEKGASMIAIICATFLLNLRHLIMSTCVANKLNKITLPEKMIGSFGVTDESFSIITSLKKEDVNIFTFFGLILVSYLAWVLGSLLGALLSDLLPDFISGSLGIALYAMFIGLLTPKVRGNFRLFLLVLLSGAMNAGFNFFLPASWSLIISTLLGAFIGLFLVDDKSVLLEEVVIE